MYVHETMDHLGLSSRQGLKANIYAYSLLIQMCSPLHPSIKERNYGIRADQFSSGLTKFIVNSINIYISK
jgi:hypothetical protein